MAYKVLISGNMVENGAQWLREHGYEVKYGRNTDKKALIEDLQDCDAMIVRLAPIDDEVITACPKLKVIARHGVGVETVDLESAKRHNVRVLNTRGSNTQAVAEHAVALMVACSKGIIRVQNFYRSGDYERARKETGSVELAGKTLGLLGMGNIGSVVGRVAAEGFQMKVLVYDPYRKDRDVPYATFIDDRDEFFRQADFITVHLLATPQTKKSIGRHEFELMKPTAYLINTSRGTIVDEPALIEALQSKKIAGAGLDVTDPEPAAPNSPLLSMDNVIMTPHCAGSTPEARARTTVEAAQGIDDILNGRVSKNTVV